MLTKVSVGEIAPMGNLLASSTFTSAATVITGLKSTQNEAKKTDIEKAFDFSEE
ncbi:hypothetical protein TURTL08_15820 [Turicimonas sp. TL08]